MDGTQIGTYVSGTGAWAWVNAGSTAVSTGIHTLNVRRREDGFILDRVYLTKNGDTPTGDGPAESDRGTAYTYSWDFENDATPDSTDQNPTHTYASYGVYTAVLPVSDGTNQDTDQVNIIVGGLRGDANGTGYVDDDDLSILLTNWNAMGAAWAHGDFTNNQYVDDDDLSWLLTNWNAGPGSPTAAPGMAEPEASSVGLTGPAAAEDLQTSSPLSNLGDIDDGEEQQDALSGNSAANTGFSVLPGNLNNGVEILTGDVNSDGIVNDDDLSILLTNWNAQGTEQSAGDISGDGLIDIFDLSDLLINWDAVMPSL